MGITNSRSVIIKNKNGDVIKEYPSLTKCSKDLGITKYKLENYAANNEPYNDMYFQINLNMDKFQNTKCDYCGKEFKCLIERLEKRQHIFCSKECSDKYARESSELNATCLVCGKRFHITPYRLNKTENHYCSRECHRIAKMSYMLGDKNHQFGLLGNKNASWKSDEKISYYGYKLVRNLDHPFRNTDGFVFEHRLVAEKYLLNDTNSIEINGNLYLSSDYVVHHLDFNRLNNRVDNLLVMKRSEHSEMHMKITHDITKLIEYCNNYNLNFDTVYNNHIYNTNHYKYNKNNVED